VWKKARKRESQRAIYIHTVTRCVRRTKGKGREMIVLIKGTAVKPLERTGGRRKGGEREGRMEKGREGSS